MLEKEAKEKGSIEAVEEMQKMERQKKLHVGNISKDKYNSKHEKSSASNSADPVQKQDEKVKVAEFKDDTFVDGYEEFLKVNRPIL